MALIIPPGFLQAVYTFALAGDSEPIVVTCGHEIDSGSGANADDAADDLHNAFGTEVVAEVMSNQYSLAYTVVYIGNDGPTIVNISGDPAYQGPGTSTVVPQNTAALIRKRTDLGGRRGRGRMYLPGVPESVVDAVGVLEGTYVDQLQTAFDAWLDFLTTSVGGRHYPPVVLHRSEGAGTEPAPTPIQSLVVEGRVATQRRRLRP